MKQIKSTQPSGKEQRTAIIAQWQQGGKTKAEFCREQGINYQTFIGWTCPKKKKDTISGEPAAFIPFELNDQRAGVFAELFFQNGRRIIFHQPVDVHYLKSLLK